MDGHERSDVVEYRKGFLKTMNELQLYVGTLVCLSPLCQQLIC